MVSATLLAEPLPPSSPILIVEVQTGTTTSASEEFIELVNVSDSDVDMSSWRVEYFSASSADFEHPSRNITLHGILSPGDHYLLASTGYLTDIANDTFSAGLAKTGGHVRLISATDTTTTVHDLLGWGTALHPLGSAATAAADGQSLQRKIEPSTGEFVNTANNAKDFEAGTPSPQGHVPPPAEEEPAPPAEEPAPEPETQPVDETPEPDPEINGPVLASPYITELLPNPAPPATDSDDEFVELYNPNSVQLDLTGYKLQSGASYNHNFTFNGQTIPAQSYAVFYVSETKLVLVNESGKARLISPDSNVISETDLYEKANDGQVWMWDGALWQWSITPTPGKPNTLTLVAAKPAKTAAAKTTSAKKKSSAAKKVKSATTKKSKKTPAVAVAPIDDSGEAAVQPIHPAVLAVVGGLALLYALYEYRHDMANFIYKLRRNRRLGFKNRTSA